MTEQTSKTARAILEQMGVTDFEGVSISIEELDAIHQHYNEMVSEHEDTADMLAARLRRIPQVHSVRARVKDPGHVLEKIVRKQKDGGYQDISRDNYYDQDHLTDLVGVRAIHLYKTQWDKIDAFVRSNFNVREGPIVKVREGDDKSHYPDENVQVHPAGYRSVHYVVMTQIGLHPVFAELQVRTIFEEGWSEVDHTVRYPSFSDDPSLEALLSVFNRVAGMADEMTLLTLNLAAAQRDANRRLEELGAEHEKRLAQQNQVIQGLEEQVKNLKEAPNSNTQSDLLRGLAALRANPSPSFRDYMAESRRQNEHRVEILRQASADWRTTRDLQAMAADERDRMRALRKRMLGQE